MKTTLQGLQALQIALRNRVERLPDGSITIKIKNDFQCVTLGDLAAFVEAASSRIRFSRKDLDSNYNFYFMEMSRNQAKRLRKRLQDWVDAEIENEIAAQCAERGQSGNEAGERLRTVLLCLQLGADPGAVLAKTSEMLPNKTPNSFPPADLGQGSAVFEDYLNRKAMEAAKDAEIEQLKSDLEAANLTKDGALKTAEKAITERDKLKTTNAELVRQAQAHNQEAIQLREALDNMTRLRNEALGKSVRLPNEGETIEVKDIFTGAWSEVAAKAFANGRIGVPVKFGVMWTEAPNYGITWRWPTKKERTATDAKPFDSVWLFIHGKKLLGRIDHFDDPEVVCTYSQAAGWRRQARILIDSFGKSWGFAD